MLNRRTFFKWSAGGLALLGLGGTYSAMSNSYYTGPVSDHFDGTRFFVPDHPQTTGFTDLLRWRFGGDARAVWPPEIASSFADAPPERSDALRVTLIGHASFLVQVAGHNMLVDPVYADRVSPVSFAGPKRANAPGIAFEKLPPIDTVLITHGHYDHLDVTTLARLHQRFKPRFVAPLGNDSIMASHIGGRDNARALDWGQSLELGNDITVHVVPSFHWSARSLTDRRKSLWGSFVLTTPRGTIYHIGDTGYGDGRFSREVAQRFGKIDLAHIPIGAYEPRWFMQGQHVNPEEAVRIFNDCGAQQAIGHHWGTFQLTNEAHEQPETDLRAALVAANIGPTRFVAFRPGQVLNV